MKFSGGGARFTAAIPWGRPCCDIIYVPFDKTILVQQTFFSEITLIRGCCSVKEDSSVCPPGSEQQIIENEQPHFTTFLVGQGAYRHTYVTRYSQKAG